MKMDHLTYASEEIKTMEDKYKDSAIRFYEKPDKYELWFMNEFVEPVEAGTVNADLCNAIIDLMHSNIDKELHIFIWSIGGSTRTLSTILQLIRRFKKTVAISLGTVYSCGWDLFFSCDERYATKHSSFMFHDTSIEIARRDIKSALAYAECVKRKMNAMLGNDGREYLTDEEKKSAETGDIWLTGDDIIKRGGCKDFSLYRKN